MDELELGPGLVGQRVINPARREWGIGTVVRVQRAIVEGTAHYRVSVQFATGHRVLQVPPARLEPPQPEAERQTGWLDAAAGNTLDARLWALPESVTRHLGTPAQRLTVLAPLYEFSDEPKALGIWARRQTGVGDPLTLWSRDELTRAFAKFCDERDADLRVTAARVVQAGGPVALEAALAGLPAVQADGVRAALRKPI